MPVSYEAMSYHYNLYRATGRVKFEKGSNHTSGYAVESKNPVRRNAVPLFANGSEMVMKAVLKAVQYRTEQGMKLELYLDMSGRGERFDKVLEYEDRGDWGPTQVGNAECHATENVVLPMARVAIGLGA